MGHHASKFCFDYDNETPNKKNPSKPNFNIWIFPLGKNQIWLVWILPYFVYKY